MKFSPDGRWLATVGDGCRLWDVRTWETHLHLPNAWLPNFSADGRLMVAEVARGVLALLDPTAGRDGWFLQRNQRALTNTVEQLAAFVPGFLALAAGVRGDGEEGAVPGAVPGAGA